jgi:hypothetical protein
VSIATKTVCPSLQGQCVHRYKDCVSIVTRTVCPLIQGLCVHCYKDCLCVHCYKDYLSIATRTGYPLLQGLGVHCYKDCVSIATRSVCIPLFILLFILWLYFAQSTNGAPLIYRLIPSLNFSYNFKMSDNLVSSLLEVPVGSVVYQGELMRKGVDGVWASCTDETFRFVKEFVATSGSAIPIAGSRFQWVMVDEDVRALCPLTLFDDSMGNRPELAPTLEHSGGSSFSELGKALTSASATRAGRGRRRGRD